jgi:hypothetical protein
MIKSRFTRLLYIEYSVLVFICPPDSKFAKAVAKIWIQLKWTAQQNLFHQTLTSRYDHLARYEV